MANLADASQDNAKENHATGLNTFLKGILNSGGKKSQSTLSEIKENAKHALLSLYCDTIPYNTDINTTDNVVDRPGTKVTDASSSHGQEQTISKPLPSKLDADTIFEWEKLLVSDPLNKACPKWNYSGIEAIDLVTDQYTTSTAVGRISSETTQEILFEQSNANVAGFRPPPEAHCDPIATLKTFPNALRSDAELSVKLERGGGIQSVKPSKNNNSYPQAVHISQNDAIQQFPTSLNVQSNREPASTLKNTYLITILAESVRLNEHGLFKLNEAKNIFLCYSVPIEVERIPLANTKSNAAHTAAAKSANRAARGNSKIRLLKNEKAKSNKIGSSESKGIQIPSVMQLEEARGAPVKNPAMRSIVEDVVIALCRGFTQDEFLLTFNHQSAHTVVGEWEELKNWLIRTNIKMICCVEYNRKPVVETIGRNANKKMIPAPRGVVTSAVSENDTKIWSYSIPKGSEIVGVAEIPWNESTFTDSLTHTVSVNLKEVRRVNIPTGSQSLVNAGNIGKLNIQLSIKALGNANAKTDASIPSTEEINNSGSPHNWISGVKQPFHISSLPPSPSIDRVPNKSSNKKENTLIYLGLYVGKIWNVPLSFVSAEDPSSGLYCRCKLHAFQEGQSSPITLSAQNYSVGLEGNFDFWMISNHPFWTSSATGQCIANSVVTELNIEIWKSCRLQDSQREECVGIIRVAVPTSENGDWLRIVKDSTYSILTDSSYSLKKMDVNKTIANCRVALFAGGLDALSLIHKDPRVQRCVSPAPCQQQAPVEQQAPCPSGGDTLKEEQNLIHLPDNDKDRTTTACFEEDRESNCMDETRSKQQPKEKVERSINAEEAVKRKSSVSFDLMEMPFEGLAGAHQHLLNQNISAKDLVQYSKHNHLLEATKTSYLKIRLSVLGMAPSSIEGLLCALQLSRKMGRMEVAVGVLDFHHQIALQVCNALNTENGSSNSPSSSSEQKRREEDSDDIIENFVVYRYIKILKETAMHTICHVIAESGERIASISERVERLISSGVTQLAHESFLAYTQQLASSKAPINNSILEMVYELLKRSETDHADMIVFAKLLSKYSLEEERLTIKGRDMQDTAYKLLYQNHVTPPLLEKELTKYNSAYSSSSYHVVSILSFVHSLEILLRNFIINTMITKMDLQFLGRYLASSQMKGGMLIHVLSLQSGSDALNIKKSQKFSSATFIDMYKCFWKDHQGDDPLLYSKSSMQSVENTGDTRTVKQHLLTKSKQVCRTSNSNKAEASMSMLDQPLSMKREGSMKLTLETSSLHLWKIDPKYMIRYCGTHELKDSTEVISKLLKKFPSHHSPAFCLLFDFHCTLKSGSYTPKYISFALSCMDALRKEYDSKWVVQNEYAAEVHWWKTYFNIYADSDAAKEAFDWMVYILSIYDVAEEQEIQQTPNIVDLHVWQIPKVQEIERLNSLPAVEFLTSYLFLVFEDRIMNIQLLFASSAVERFFICCQHWNIDLYSSSLMSLCHEGDWVSPQQLINWITEMQLPLSLVDCRLIASYFSNYGSLGLLYIYVVDVRNCHKRWRNSNSLRGMYPLGDMESKVVTKSSECDGYGENADLTEEERHNAELIAYGCLSLPCYAIFTLLVTSENATERFVDVQQVQSFLRNIFFLPQQLADAIASLLDVYGSSHLTYTEFRRYLSYLKSNAVLNQSQINTNNCSNETKAALKVEFLLLMAVLVMPGDPFKDALASLGSQLSDCVTAEQLTQVLSVLELPVSQAHCIYAVWNATRCILRPDEDSNFHNFLEWLRRSWKYNNTVLSDFYAFLFYKYPFKSLSEIFASLNLSEGKEDKLSLEDFTGFLDTIDLPNSLMISKMEVLQSMDMRKTKKFPLKYIDDCYNKFVDHHSTLLQAILNRWKVCNAYVEDCLENMKQIAKKGLRLFSKRSTDVSLSMKYTTAVGEIAIARHAFVEYFEELLLHTSFGSKKQSIHALFDFLDWKNSGYIEYEHLKEVLLSCAAKMRTRYNAGCSHTEAIQLHMTMSTHSAEVGEYLLAAELNDAGTSTTSHPIWNSEDIFEMMYIIEWRKLILRNRWTLHDFFRQLGINVPHNINALQSSTLTFKEFMESTVMRNTPFAFPYSHHSEHFFIWLVNEGTTTETARKEQQLPNLPAVRVATCYQLYTEITKRLKCNQTFFKALSTNVLHTIFTEVLRNQLDVSQLLEMERPSKFNDCFSSRPYQELNKWIPSTLSQADWESLKYRWCDPIVEFDCCFPYQKLYEELQSLFADYVASFQFKIQNISIFNVNHEINNSTAAESITAATKCICSAFSAEGYSFSFCEILNIIYALLYYTYDASACSRETIIPEVEAPLQNGVHTFLRIMENCVLHKLRDEDTFKQSRATDVISSKIGALYEAPFWRQLLTCFYQYIVSTRISVEQFLRSLDAKGKLYISKDDILHSTKMIDLTPEMAEYSRKISDNIQLTYDEFAEALSFQLEKLKLSLPYVFLNADALAAKQFAKFFRHGVPIDSTHTQLITVNKSVVKSWLLLLNKGNGLPLEVSRTACEELLASSGANDSSAIAWRLQSGLPSAPTRFTFFLEWEPSLRLSFNKLKEEFMQLCKFSNAPSAETLTESRIDTLLKGQLPAQHAASIAHRCSYYSAVFKRSLGDSFVEVYPSQPCSVTALVCVSQMGHYQHDIEVTMTSLCTTALLPRSFKVYYAFRGSAYDWESHLLDLTQAPLDVKCRHSIRTADKGVHNMFGCDSNEGNSLLAISIARDSDAEVENAASPCNAQSSIIATAAFRLGEWISFVSNLSEKNKFFGASFCKTLAFQMKQDGHARRADSIVHPKQDVASVVVTIFYRLREVERLEDFEAAVESRYEGLCIKELKQIQHERVASTHKEVEDITSVARRTNVEACRLEAIPSDSKAINGGSKFQVDVSRLPMRVCYLQIKSLIIHKAICKAALQNLVAMDWWEKEGTSLALSLEWLDGSVKRSSTVPLRNGMVTMCSRESLEASFFVLSIDESFDFSIRENDRKIVCKVSVEYQKMGGSVPNPIELQAKSIAMGIIELPLYPAGGTEAEEITVPFLYETASLFFPIYLKDASDNLDIEATFEAHASKLLGRLELNASLNLVDNGWEELNARKVSKLPARHTHRAPSGLLFSPFALLPDAVPYNTLTRNMSTTMIEKLVLQLFGSAALPSFHRGGWTPKGSFVQLFKSKGLMGELQYLQNIFDELNADLPPTDSCLLYIIPFLQCLLLYRILKKLHRVKNEFLREIHANDNEMVGCVRWNTFQHSLLSAQHYYEFEIVLSPEEWKSLFEWSPWRNKYGNYTSGTPNAVPYIDYYVCWRDIEKLQRNYHDLFPHCQEVERDRPIHSHLVDTQTNSFTEERPILVEINLTGVRQLPTIFGDEPNAFATFSILVLDPNSKPEGLMPVDDYRASGCYIAQDAYMTSVSYGSRFPTWYFKSVVKLPPITELQRRTACFARHTHGSAAANSLGFFNFLHLEVAVWHTPNEPERTALPLNRPTPYQYVPLNCMLIGTALVPLDPLVTSQCRVQNVCDLMLEPTIAAEYTGQSLWGYSKLIVSVQTLKANGLDSSIMHETLKANILVEKHRLQHPVHLPSSTTRPLKDGNKFGSSLAPAHYTEKVVPSKVEIDGNNSRCMYEPVKAGAEDRISQRLRNLEEELRLQSRERILNKHRENMLELEKIIQKGLQYFQPKGELPVPKEYSEIVTADIYSPSQNEAITSEANAESSYEMTADTKKDGTHVESTRPLKVEAMIQNNHDEPLNRRKEDTMKQTNECILTNTRSEGGSLHSRKGSEAVASFKEMSQPLIEKIDKCLERSKHEVETMKMSIRQSESSQSGSASATSDSEDRINTHTHLPHLSHAIEKTASTAAATHEPRSKFTFFPIGHRPTHNADTANNGVNDLREAWRMPVQDGKMDVLVHSFFSTSDVLANSAFEHTASSAMTAQLVSTSARLDANIADPEYSLCMRHAVTEVTYEKADFTHNSDVALSDTSNSKTSSNQNAAEFECKYNHCTSSIYSRGNLNEDGQISDSMISLDQCVLTLPNAEKTSGGIPFFQNRPAATDGDSIYQIMMNPLRCPDISTRECGKDASAVSEGKIASNTTHQKMYDNN